MTARTHIACGVALAGIVCGLARVDATPALLVAAGFGALGPDLDHPNALGTRHLVGSAAVAHIPGIHHRGFTHSFVAAALVLVVGRLIAPSVDAWLLALAGAHGLAHMWLALRSALGGGVPVGLALGFVSHDLSDALNTKGVQWLWPARLWLRAPLGPLAIPVGTWKETLFRLALYGVLLWRDVRVGLATLVLTEVVYHVVVAMPALGHARRRTPTGHDAGQAA
jgi:inner membrane protein